MAKAKKKDAATESAKMVWTALEAQHEKDQQAALAAAKTEEHEPWLTALLYQIAHTKSLHGATVLMHPKDFGHFMTVAPGSTYGGHGAGGWEVAGVPIVVSDKAEKGKVVLLPAPTVESDHLKFSWPKTKTTVTAIDYGTATVKMDTTPLVPFFVNGQATFEAGADIKAGETVKIVDGKAYPSGWKPAEKGETGLYEITSAAISKATAAMHAELEKALWENTGKPFYEKHDTGPKGVQNPPPDPDDYEDDGDAIVAKPKPKTEDFNDEETYAWGDEPVAKPKMPKPKSALYPSKKLVAEAAIQQAKLEEFLFGAGGVSGPIPPLPQFEPTGYAHCESCGPDQGYDSEGKCMKCATPLKMGDDE